MSQASLIAFGVANALGSPISSMNHSFGCTEKVVVRCPKTLLICSSKSALDVVARSRSSGNSYPKPPFCASELAAMAPATQRAVKKQLALVCILDSRLL